MCSGHCHCSINGDAGSLTKVICHIDSFLFIRRLTCKKLLGWLDSIEWFHPKLCSLLATAVCSLGCFQIYNFGSCCGSLPCNTPVTYSWGGLHFITQKSCSVIKTKLITFMLSKHIILFTSPYWKPGDKLKVCWQSQMIRNNNYSMYMSYFPRL